MGKVIYTILGWIAVSLGVIGIVLPVLPTTPFMILAAFLFAKGSPRARAWLIEHPKFDAHILNWEAEGAISPSAKKMAVIAMGLVFFASLLLGVAWYVLLIQGLCMGTAAVFVWTRPDPQNPAP